MDAGAKPRQPMSFPGIILGYVAVWLAAVAGLAVWDVLRRRRFQHGAHVDNVFRCEGCRYVYTDDHDEDRSRCPQCGRTNEPFSF